MIVKLLLMLARMGKVRINGRIGEREKEVDFRVRQGLRPYNPFVIFITRHL
jgi:hypothetical protein